MASSNQGDVSTLALMLAAAGASALTMCYVSRQEQLEKAKLQKAKLKSSLKSKRSKSKTKARKASKEAEDSDSDSSPQASLSKARPTRRTYARKTSADGTGSQPMALTQSMAHTRSDRVRQHNEEYVESFRRNSVASNRVQLNDITSGFSMQDAREMAEHNKEKLLEQDPEDVLADLQRGNTRFWMGIAHSPEVSAFQRRALIMNQYPRVAMLACADSRVPTEIVFDQSLGDIFVVRVAGNVLDLAAQASLQYAVVHLKVKLVLVMGHEGCGTVKAAFQPAAVLEAMSPNLSQMLLDLKSGLDETRILKLRDPRARDREAVVTNVNRVVTDLMKDQSIMGRVRSKDLLICGAFYEISSGIVDFFNEVSDTGPSRTTRLATMSATPKGKFGGWLFNEVFADEKRHSLVLDSLEEDS